MKPEKLLTRDAFREAVFARDNHTCVFCDQPAVDAHHILERRLFSGEQLGGYFLSNGASVCGEHHMLCETTEISVDDVRVACGITKPTIPEHMYADQTYDKWGNIILTNGTRTKGELFYDESVQKVLAKGKVLDLFTDYVKYPRTHHLPYSPGMTDDDRVHQNMDFFEGKRVILTVKMDGENTSMYRDYIHARSLDGRHHESRDWVKSFWSKISYEIPEGFRLCGENLYAEHSLRYENLKGYFYLFSLWDRNICKSWDETVMWADVLEIPLVPVLYDGIYDSKKIQTICETMDTSINEGAVLRLADEFDYSQFKSAVAKFVRANHVTTGQHWKFGRRMIPNGLITEPHE